MTLLSAILAVADKAGYTVDRSYVMTSTDTTTVQLRAMAQDVIKEMGQAYEWTKIYRSGTITLVSGQNTYALPNDFSYYHHDTFWNSTQRWPMYGPLSPEDYGTIIGYGLTAMTYSQFQITGIADQQFLIYPTPTASGNVLTYQYMSNRYARPQTWAAATVFAANSYCFYNGNYYITTAGGTGGSAPTHTSGTVGIWTYYDGAYDSFVADTDEPLFSQRTLELGLFERFAEIKQLAFQPRYLDALNEEFSRNIPGQDVYADDSYSRYVLQGRSSTVVFGRPLG